MVNLTISKLWIHYTSIVGKKVNSVSSTCKSEQKIYCLKTVKSTDMWQISRPPLRFGVGIINVWSLMAKYKRKDTI